MYRDLPWLEGLATNLRDQGSIPSGGPKRFHDSFNFVFYIVGECLSSAVDTSLARIRPLSLVDMSPDFDFIIERLEASLYDGKICEAA